MIDEFLTSRSLNDVLPQSVMTKTCLIYLLFDIFEDGPCNEETSFASRLQKHPFAQYAARYWAIHLKEADRR